MFYGNLPSMEIVIWKDVVGYEGFYLVSNTGKVKSMIKNKVLSPFINNSGYYRVHLRGGRKFSIHRLVCMAFIGDPCGFHVNHKDRDKLNNNIENLEYVTMKKNSLYIRTSKRGVSMCGPSTFRARIWINDRMEHIGKYLTKEDAYSAYYDKFIEVNGFNPW